MGGAPEELMCTITGATKILPGATIARVSGPRLVADMTQMVLVVSLISVASAEAVLKMADFFAASMSRCLAFSGYAGSPFIKGYRVDGDVLLERLFKEASVRFVMRMLMQALPVVTITDRQNAVDRLRATYRSYYNRFFSECIGGVEQSSPAQVSAVAEVRLYHAVLQLVGSTYCGQIVDCLQSQGVASEEYREQQRQSPPAYGTGDAGRPYFFFPPGGGYLECAEVKSLRYNAILAKMAGLLADMVPHQSAYLSAFIANHVVTQVQRILASRWNMQKEDVLSCLGQEFDGNGSDDGMNLVSHWVHLWKAMMGRGRNPATIVHHGKARTIDALCPKLAACVHKDFVGEQVCSIQGQQNRFVASGAAEQASSPPEDQQLAAPAARP